MVGEDFVRSLAFNIVRHSEELLDYSAMASHDVEKRKLICSKGNTFGAQKSI